jgi:hypothetical protein
VRALRKIWYEWNCNSHSYSGRAVVSDQIAEEVASDVYTESDFRFPVTTLIAVTV